MFIVYGHALVYDMSSKRSSLVVTHGALIFDLLGYNIAAEI